MATAGQIKPKIDLLKKKIAEKGATLAPERRRRLAKRLRRLQRARRKAVVADRKRQDDSKGKGKGKRSQDEAAAPGAPTGA